MKHPNSPIYVFPAIFTPEDKGKYSIRFPDIDGCYTCGDNIEEGILMAEDALALTLYSNYEDKNVDVPESSPVTDFILEDGEFVAYITCDTTKYRRQFGTKSVKKTLTIPEWLNDAAVKERINFSQVLQDALREKLHV